ncbi:MAG: hypothetical protein M3040_18160, partial [Bacteroidota bacterium]|nr:hypothetical protein [Bacteroidota bacterium]
MKKALMLLCIILSTSFIHAAANDSCKVFFNKQLLFKGEVDQQASVALIKATHISKKDCITIVYNSENADKGWDRTFYINAADEKNLKTITISNQSGSVSVTASVLN